MKLENNGVISFSISVSLIQIFYVGEVISFPQRLKNKIYRFSDTTYFETLFILLMISLCQEYFIYCCSEHFQWIYQLQLNFDCFFHNFSNPVIRFIWINVRNTLWVLCQNSFLTPCRLEHQYTFITNKARGVCS